MIFIRTNWKSALAGIFKRPGRCFLFARIVRLDAYGTSKGIPSEKIALAMGPMHKFALARGRPVTSYDSWNSHSKYNIHLLTETISFSFNCIFNLLDNFFFDFLFSGKNNCSDSFFGAQLKLIT